MKVEDAEPDSYVDEHGRFFKPAAVRPLPSKAKRPRLSHEHFSRRTLQASLCSAMHTSGSAQQP